MSRAIASANALTQRGLDRSTTDHVCSHNAIHIAPCFSGSDGSGHQSSCESTYCGILDRLSRGGGNVEELRRWEGEEMRCTTRLC